jgi:hypothetical protein
LRATRNLIVCGGAVVFIRVYRLIIVTIGSTALRSQVSFGARRPGHPRLPSLEARTDNCADATRRLPSNARTMLAAERLSGIRQR